jgi:hypothetical protein
MQKQKKGTGHTTIISPSTSVTDLFITPSLSAKILRAEILLASHKASSFVSLISIPKKISKPFFI